MFRWIRRHQPAHPLVAVLYWAAVTLVVLTVLFVAFFYLDNFLPAMY